MQLYVKRKQKVFKSFFGLLNRFKTGAGIRYVEHSGADGIIARFNVPFPGGILLLQVNAIMAEFDESPIHSVFLFRR